MASLAGFPQQTRGEFARRGEGLTAVHVEAPERRRRGPGREEAVEEIEGHKERRAPPAAALRDRDGGACPQEHSEIISATQPSPEIFVWIIRAELPPLGKVAAPVQARLQATRLEALQAAPVWPPLTVALPQRLETAGWAQQSPPHSVTLPPIGP